MMLRSLIWFWLLLFPSLLMAGFPPQELIWQAYSLPGQVEGHCVFADSTGYAWVGAQGKVLRFDGREWTHITLPQHEKSPVSAFAEQVKGNIWVGLGNGNLYQIKGDSARLFAPEEGLPKAAIRSILFDRQGIMWIATYGEGVYYFWEGRLYQIDASEGLPSEDIYTLSLAKDGRVWAATDQGIGICSHVNGKKQVETLDTRQGLPDEIIPTVGHDARGAWIGTYDKGTFFQPSRGQNWRSSEPLNTLTLSQIAACSRGAWGLDQKGIIWQLGEKSFPIQAPEVVKHLHLSPTARLWVLLQSGKIAQAPLYARTFSLEALDPQALALTKEENVWVGSQKGLWLYSPDIQSLTSIPGTQNLNITSLYVDEKEQLWMGTLGQGLWHLSAQDKPSLVPLKSISSQVPILSLAGHEDTLWLGTFAGALQCITGLGGNIKTEKSLRNSKGGTISYSYQVTTNTSGGACFATDGNGLIQFPSSQTKMSSGTFYAHCEDESGAFYALDNEGSVVKLGTSGIDTLTDPHEALPLSLLSLKAGVLLAIYQDEMLWVETHTGQAFPFLPAVTRQGMGSHLHVHIRDKEGKIWIGKKGKLLLIDPEALPTSFSPGIQLASLLIRLKAAPPLSKTYPHDENHLTWNYTSFWWDAPEQVSFRHQLEGHDLDWVSSRDQRAMYPDLSPGTYTLKIQAGLRGAFDQAASYQHSFTIRSPFWQSPWFLFACFILTVAGVYLYFKRREQIRLRKQEQEQMMAENQFETLRSQINPHFLFNAFSTLIDLVEESPPHAVNYINRLSDMFRDVLAYRDKPLISLEQELEILDNYYHLQKERYGENFNLIIEVDESQKVLSVPPMVLQILVENALKHNKVSSRFPLWVEIKTVDNNLIISNPIQLRSVSSASTRVGLANIRSRYALLTDQPIRISDDGALFSLTLPLLPNSPAS